MTRAHCTFDQRYGQEILTLTRAIMIVKTSFGAALAGTIILGTFLFCTIVDAETASGNQAVLLSRILNVKHVDGKTSGKQISPAGNGGAVQFETIHEEDDDDYFDEENEGGYFADSMDDVDRMHDYEWEEGDNENQWADDDEGLEDNNHYVHMISDEYFELEDENDDQDIPSVAANGGNNVHSLGVALPTDRGNKFIGPLKAGGMTKEDELEHEVDFSDHLVMEDDEHMDEGADDRDSTSAQTILSLGEEKLEV